MSTAARQVRQPQARTKKKSTAKKKFKVFFALGFILFVICFIAGSFEAMKRLNKAAALVPKLPAVMAELNSTPSEIVSSDGVPLFRIQTEYRKGVRRADIPQKVVNATLAAEDKRFYDHNGIDFIGLVRLGVNTLQSGSPGRGASTLTMQISKMVFTSNERSIERKLDDMALAVQIERNLTKDQIIELYLNESYFGEGAYGIVAAADVYFGKTLDKLTNAECAMLARCVRRPSDENPFKDLETSTKNRDAVLAIMLEEKMLSQDEYEEAIKEPVKLRKERSGITTNKKVAPYFVDYVLKQLRGSDIDISRGGYTVYTTLSYKLQQVAEDGVKRAIRKMSRYSVNRMGFLCTDNTGRIIAMVPDTDYSKRQFNMMDQPPGRQPGSSFKPFVYAAGIELGAFGSYDTISTAPYIIKDDRGRRRPIKGGANRGNISISSALASSNNTAAVRAQELTGTNNVIRIAKTAFGFQRSNLPPVEVLALGAGEVLMTEMASAYSVFQNHGDRRPVYGIERIKKPDGSLIYMQPAVVRNVISNETADAMDLMLRGVATGGTGRAASVVKNARGKTGTTSSNKDAWFCGYTDKLLGICWMSNIVEENGRPVSKPMSSYVMGGTGAAPAWADIMKRIQGEIDEDSRAFGRIPGVSHREVTDEPEEDTKPPEEDIKPPQNPTEEITPPPLEDPLKTGDGQTVSPDQTDPASGTTGTTRGTTTGTSPTGGNRTATSAGNKDIVYVTVCADSGQRSTVYCPEAVKRPYVKGTEPRGRCPIHGP